MLRRDEFSRTFRLSHLNETAHAHRLPVSRDLRGLLTEFGRRFSAHTEISSRQRCKNTVAGAIGEVRGVDCMPLLRRGLPSGYAHDMLPVHFALTDGAV